MAIIHTEFTAANILRYETMSFFRGMVGYGCSWGRKSYVCVCVSTVAGFQVHKTAHETVSVAGF